MKLLLLILICMIRLSLPVSAEYPTRKHVKPQHSKYDRFELFHLYNYIPNDSYTKNKNPFSTIQEQLLKYGRKRLDLKKRGAAKSYKYKRIKDKITELEVEITAIYHKRLRNDTIRFFEINKQVRHYLRLCKQKKENTNECAKQLDKYKEQGQEILQRMIDTVVAHQALPTNYAPMPTEHKNFYRDLSDRVHKKKKFRKESKPIHQ